jgi:hypothetical protein
VTGRPDGELPWGSDSADDLIEQGDEEAGRDWLGGGRPGGGWPGGNWSRRFRWPPRGGRLIAGLVVIALAAGLLGGYLAGDAHGRHRVAAAKPARPAVSTASVGLAETGSQCSTVLGHSMQLGVEVVNGSPVDISLGQLTARFPSGGLKLTVASWGPCGTLPFAHSAVDTVLASGASTWISVTVTTLAKCPRGLPVEYVASYDQLGLTYTVVLPGFADLGGVAVPGCPAPSGPP